MAPARILSHVVQLVLVRRIAGLNAIPSVHYSPGHRGHRNELWPDGGRHPERPGRLDENIVPFVPKSEVDWRVRDEYRDDAEAAVLRVHNKEYVERVKQNTELRAKLGPDTYVIPTSYPALLKAQSLWLDAVDEAITKKTSCSWALSRPPGHHASRPGNADGFCIFNFCAAAAAYALETQKIQRIALLDFDGHHGNGVAAYADEESRVSYASVHQAPLWPGTGDDATDRGPLLNRLSAPVSRGAQGEEYLERWLECLKFAQSHEPELVIVSAGFDALSADPLVQCQLEPTDFMRITAHLKHTFPDTPIVLGLEGGYSKDTGLAFVESLRPFIPTPHIEKSDSSRNQFSESKAEEANITTKDTIYLTTLKDKQAAGIRVGKVFICIDATGGVHAVCGRIPPLGLPTSAFGAFDPQVRSIAEIATGTRFYVETGEVRGAWCPKRSFYSFFLKPKRMAVAKLAVIDNNTVAITPDDLQRLSTEFDRLEQFAQATWIPFKKFVLAGITSRYRLDSLAASAPITISTTARTGSVRTTALALGGLEIGYYLVRTPRPSDPPTTATDFVIADILHNGNFDQIDKNMYDDCAKVAVGVAVFVEPAARNRKLGLILFKQAMLACRRLGYRYMLFVERDTGSGRLVQWYENMGFSKIPPDAMPGLDRAMIGRLPDPDTEPEFYDLPLSDSHDQAPLSVVPYQPPSSKLIWSLDSFRGDLADFLRLTDDSSA